MGRGGAIICSFGTQHSLGQIILVKKNFPFEINTEFSSNRILTISFQTDRYKVNIINVYSPTQAHEKSIFLNNLSQHLNQLEGGVVLCGDFNCVLDNKLDIISGEPHNIRNIENFKDFVINHDLSDTWRLFHPEEKEYTWCRNNPFTSRRLDFIFTSNEIFNTTFSCNISSRQTLKRLKSVKPAHTVKTP